MSTLPRYDALDMVRTDTGAFVLAPSGTSTVAPAMTLRAQANDVNAAFQGIAVH